MQSKLHLVDVLLYGRIPNYILVIVIVVNK